MLKRSSKFSWLLFLLILSLISILRIGDFNVRLANATNDESIITFSRFLENPQRYKGDVLETYGYIFGLSTIVNSLPHFLSIYFKIPLKIIVWFMIYLQSILLGFAFLYYARYISGREDIAWITGIFAVIVMPWVWNLANFTSFLFRTTYPACFAVSLILLTAIQAIKRNRLITTLLLVICGLVHPLITSWMIFLVGILWGLESGLKNWKENIKRILPLTISIIVCIIPLVLWTANVSDRLSASESMEVISYNMHSNPTIYPLFWYYNIPMFFWMVTVLIFVFRQQKKYLKPEIIHFFLATVVTVVMFSMSHIVGLIWKIPRFAQVIGLRTTMLLMIFPLPLLISYLVDKISHKNLVVSWAGAAALFLQAFFTYGVFWGPYFALFFADYSKNSAKSPDRFMGRVRKIDRLGGLIFLIWLVAVLGFGTYFFLTSAKISSRPVMSVLIPAIHINGKWFLFAIIAAFLIAVVRTRSAYLSKPLTRISGVLLIILIIIGFLRAYYSDASENRTVKAVANYQAQAWARDNTEPDALFLVSIDNTFWRVMSDRKVLYNDVYFQSPGEYYSFSRKTKQFHDDIRFFLREVRGGKANYDEADILDIAKRFGVDYVVGSIDDPLEFDIVYRNNYQIIYKLHSDDKKRIKLNEF